MFRLSFSNNYAIIAYTFSFAIFGLLFVGTTTIDVEDFTFFERAESSGWGLIARLSRDGWKYHTSSALYVEEVGTVWRFCVWSR